MYERNLSIEGAEVTYEDYEDGVIRAKTGVNLRTFGDQITPLVQKADEETTSVHIQSKPAIPTTIVDYGKNIKNVKTITTYLKPHI
ncbi:hypothetical protein [Bacillus thermotolerans]|uniref:hypothetical protein n=1 Tax=Bacillus thermotolerans TaxID=1221996 RepID=UPI0005892BCC|nr:hypothetical protein [Bacillus thermotolerans]KKB41474.1 hypothetical protein QY96_01992 [Bacillus thermotolerans]